ncbi:MAG: hypothetical protein ABW175_15110 [Bradyrhizobium sp.]
MSSGTYCVIRDLGLVKGGKGMRHHEVLMTFSARAFWHWMLGAAKQALQSHRRPAVSDASQAPESVAPPSAEISPLRRLPREQPVLGERHGHRRHVAGHAEQDDAGEQVGLAERAG